MASLEILLVLFPLICVFLVIFKIAKIFDKIDKACDIIIKNNDDEKSR